MNSTHISWIDSLKGVAILLVVLGHTLDGAPMYSGTEWMQTLHDIIYSFHMPLFFFLSGCTFSLSGKVLEWKSALLRLLELFLIYVFWSLLMYAGKSLFVSQVNKPNTHSFFYCLAFSPVDPFWYLVVLLLYSVAGFSVFRSGTKVQIVALLVSVVVSTIILRWEIIAAENGDVLRYLYRIAYHFVYFCGGMFFIKYLCSRFIPKRSFVLPCACILAATTCLTKIIFKMMFLGECCAWLCIFSLVLIFVDFGALGKNRVLRFFGRNSLYVYLLHNFVTVSARIILKNIKITGGGYLPVVFFATLAVCSAIILFVDKILILKIFFKPVKTIQALRMHKGV